MPICPIQRGPLWKERRFPAQAAVGPRTGSVSPWPAACAQSPHDASRSSPLPRGPLRDGLTASPHQAVLWVHPLPSVLLQVNPKLLELSLTFPGK